MPAQVSGARSDTTLIAHLSADRKHVTVVSIPRDSMVPMPPQLRREGPEERVAGAAGQLRVQPRWAGLPHQHDRGQHGHLHQPLRGRRLQRLQGDGRRARWRAGLHPRRDRRPQGAPPARGRPARPRRHPGARLRAGALHRGRRLGPRPDQAAAGVPVLDRAGGHPHLAAAAPGPALRLPRRRDPLADHGRGPQPGHHEGHRHVGQGHRDPERRVRHRPGRDLPAGPEPRPVDRCRRDALDGDQGRPARHREVRDRVTDPVPDRIRSP